MKTRKQADAEVRAAIDAIHATKNDAGFPNSPTPVGCEERAREAKSAHDYHLAARWFRAACACTLGHNRSQRYEEAAWRCDMEGQLADANDTLRALNAGRTAASGVASPVVIKQIDAAIQRVLDDAERFSAALAD